MDIAKTIGTVTTIATSIANLMPTVIRLVTGTQQAYEALRSVIAAHGDESDLKALAKARFDLQRIHDIAALEAEATE